MNFVEHLSNPRIGFYCYDVTVFDMKAFQQQIVLSISVFMLFMNLLNNQTLADIK